MLLQFSDSSLKGIYIKEFKLNIILYEHHVEYLHFLKKFLFYLANKEDDGFPNRNLDDSEKIEELHQLLQRIDFKQKQMLKDKGIQQPSMFLHI